MSAWTKARHEAATALCERMAHKPWFVGDLPDALVEIERLQRLIADVQAHAKEEGWQDVDEPIAALLAYPVEREGSEG